MLQNAGVEVIVDLRGVGNNVQEHYNVLVSYRTPIPFCFVMVILTEDSTEVKEEFESDYLTFDCLRDPDEHRKQTEL